MNVIDTMVLPDQLEQVARVFVLENGTVIAGRRGINFVGADVVDNPTAERVDVDIAGSGTDRALMLGGM